MGSLINRLVVNTSKPISTVHSKIHCMEILNKQGTFPFILIGIVINKANLRDLIAATGLVISNWIQIVNFYRPCDREIWWMTLKNNRTLFLYYVKLCASFQIHWWNQTGFTVQKRSIRVEIGGILSLWPWNLMGWPWKTIGHLFYAASSFVQHFVAIVEFKLELQSRNAQSGSNSTVFRAVRPWNLMDDLAKQ